MPRAPSEALNTPDRSTGRILGTLVHDQVIGSLLSAVTALRELGNAGLQVRRIHLQDDSQKVCRLAFQVYFHATVKSFPQLFETRLP